MIIKGSTSEIISDLYLENKLQFSYINSENLYPLINKWNNKHKSKINFSQDNKLICWNTDEIYLDLSSFIETFGQYLNIQTYIEIPNNKNIMYFCNKESFNIPERYFFTGTLKEFDEKIYRMNFVIYDVFIKKYTIDNQNLYFKHIIDFLFKSCNIIKEYNIITFELTDDLLSDFYIKILGINISRIDFKTYVLNFLNSNINNEIKLISYLNKGKFKKNIESYFLLFDQNISAFDNAFYLFDQLIKNLLKN